MTGVVAERDEAWERRELKFHEENIKQINEMVRRMNTLAPSVVRRGVILREKELERVRKVLHEEVKREVARKTAMERPEEKHATRTPGKVGSLFVVGLGIAALVYLRPARNDSERGEPEHKREQSEPLHAHEPVPARSISRLLLDYLVEPFLTALRFLHLVVLFGPVILTSPMLLVGKPERKRPGKPVAAEEDAWGAVWWYSFLVKQMERAGPSFIKLGQWAASRADLFPAALCERMSKLHSNGKPHSFHHTKRVIEKAFATPFDDIFEDFAHEPIGCGAIAQVYKAKLRDASTVAIKVLHPRVAKTIRRDIAIMSIFANIVNAFPGMQWISLPEEVQVFGKMMNSQLDLRVEAENLDHFERNFRDRGPRVTFPRPIDLGEEGREVLVEEYEDALPLKYFLSNGGGPYDDKIANIGLDAFLEMLLLDNWTHGDLHP